MSHRQFGFAAATLFGMLCSFGCSTGSGADSPSPISSGGTTAAGGAPGVVGFGGGGNPLVVGTGGSPPPAPGCGDGTLIDEEACDDGNQIDGDGCASNCLLVEDSYSCPTPGTACHVIARCADGVVAPVEPCDDGNALDGDGCSARCKLEPGFKCDGEPSLCSLTTCGDGVKEGTESCDDGNALPYDGCSAGCLAEPNCSGPSCTSECGDGLIIAEACDDGNSIDGDGCSSSCTQESGFICTTAVVQDACEELNGQCVLRVPMIFRDFPESHSDFGVGCGTPVTGMVEPVLGANGKPVLAAAGTTACVASAASFSEWYTDGAGRATLSGELILFDNGAGGFVNRWGENGEQWVGATEYDSIRHCGVVTPDEPGTCATCVPALAATETCFSPCTIPNGQTSNVECAATVTEGLLYDGNPLFFPIDEHPGALTDTQFPANIAAVYGHPNWPWEEDLFPGAGTHNFHFTTEVHYWFKYEAARTATLEFTGDDDVWVFLNGQLAVDLGGLHTPLTGSVDIGPATADRFGLVEGGVYRISVFHAERKRDGSSFKLTLEGFSTSRSECDAVCGDGIVSQGEECDDGLNDGGYGECDPGCVLGAYCGDGMVQGPEHCDDGNRVENDGCGLACRVVVVR